MLKRDDSGETGHRHEPPPRQADAPRASPDVRVVNAAIAAFVARLRHVGLDLVHAFSAAEALEQLPAPETSLPGLETFGGPDALGLLVGNTRALWERFTSEYRARSRAAISPEEMLHPLDHFVMRQVDGALRELVSALGHPRAHVAYSHRASPDFVPIQRIAHFAGMGHLGPAGLVVHPVHGPWIGLRAVVSLELAPTPHRAAPSDGPPACIGCPAPCVVALERAKRTPTAAHWLEVRDSCPVGRSARYTLPQIRYHYEKDCRALTEPAQLSTSSSTPRTA